VIKILVATPVKAVSGLSHLASAAEPILSAAPVATSQRLASRGFSLLASRGPHRKSARACLSACTVPWTVRSVCLLRRLLPGLPLASWSTHGSTLGPSDPFLCMTCRHRRRQGYALYVKAYLRFERKN
jgi:hypothetical protein